jgi:hypothetical protein
MTIFMQGNFFFLLHGGKLSGSGSAWIDVGGVPSPHPQQAAPKSIYFYQTAPLSAD